MEENKFRNFMRTALLRQIDNPGMNVEALLKNPDLTEEQRNRAKRNLRKIFLEEPEIEYNHYDTGDSDF